MLRRLNRISALMGKLFGLKPKLPDIHKTFPNSIQTLILTFIILLLFTGVLGAKYLSSTNKSLEPKPNVQSQQAPPIIKPLVSKKEILSEVNSYRESLGLNQVNQDNETCRISDKILNTEFWRTDYKVNDYKDLCPNCFALTIAQARDINSAPALISMWKSDSKTLETLEDAGKNACVSMDEGKVVLVVTKKNAGITAGNVVLDPIVDCNFTYLSDQKMKKSECSKSFECQISGQWYIYTSRDKCNQDQKSSQPNIPQQPSVLTNQLNYYCYDNTFDYSYYTSSGEQCNKDNAVSACIALAKIINYDPCMDKCLATASEESALCIWAYVGNAAIEENPDLYQECIDEKDANHQQCMDSCSPPYQEALSKCY